MDDPFRLTGPVLPDPWVMPRLKVVFRGICGLGASLLFMGSGMDGSRAWGGMIAAGGIVPIEIASRSIAREARQAAADRERPAWAAR